MRKAIGIIILGLLLSSNAFGSTEWLPDKTVGNASKMWNTYKSLDKPYKVFVYIIEWRAHRFAHGYTITWGEDTLKSVLDRAHFHKVCRRGCIITHINDEEISLERQMQIAKEYLPPNVYNKYLSKIEKSKPKTVAKKPEKKEPTSDDKLLAASSGSGFFVTRAGHLVTNYHVIEECDAVKVSFNAKEIQADTIAIDKFNDLAIIKAKINPSKVFPVSNKDVSLLQDIIVAGFPLGKRISAAIKTHKGSVTGLAGIGDNYSNFQTDATINHGNSGGPILTQKGNVIGVAVQLIPPDKAQNVFFGVKSSTLTTFAKANNVNFLSPNNREMSDEDLGQLITEATAFLECWMTVAKIKQMIAQEENRKAFYSEHK